MTDIFVKVLNISITASYLVLAVLLLRLILKKAPKWSVCLLWGLVALRLVMPFSLESELSLIPSANTVLVSDTADVPFEINTGVDTVDAQINDIIAENKNGINEVNQYINNSFAEVEDNLNPPSDNKNDTHQQDSDTVKKSKISIFTVLGAVWLLGVLAMLVYSAVSFLIIRRKVKACLHYRDNIYYCDSIDTSFILGIFSPKIYIQSGMSQENTDYVIKHERAHLKRCDHLLKPFAFLLLSAHWFNPLIWVAYILLCRDIESACDERVIEDENIGDIVGYSSALLECGTKRQKLLACPVAFGEVSVKSRIKSVLKYKRPADWLAALSVVLAVAVGVGFLTNPKDKVSALTNESSNVSSSEETVEIITSETENNDKVLHNQNANDAAPKENDELSDNDYSGTSSEISLGNNVSMKPPVKNDSSQNEISSDSSENLNSNDFQGQNSSQNTASDIVFDLPSTEEINGKLCYKYTADGNVTDWIIDGDYVHMTFKKENKYKVFDTNTGLIVKEKILSGRNAEMHCFGDELWLSYPDLKCIKIHDKDTFSVKGTMYFDYDISSFDIYGKYLIFAEDDQHVSCYRYNLDTGEIVQIKGSFYMADILVNAEYGLVYISDSHSSRCYLYCYDIETLSVNSCYQKDGYGYVNKVRRSFLNDGFVYWGEFKLNALNVSRVEAQYSGNYPAGMFQVDKNFVITTNGIYSKDTYQMIDDLRDVVYLPDAIALTQSGNILAVDCDDILYILPNG